MSENDTTLNLNWSQSPDQLPPGFQSPAGGLIIYRVTQQGCTTPNRPYLKGVNQTTKQVLFFQPDCKSWSCPHCAEIRKKRWQWRATNGVTLFLVDNREIDFVTVTSHEKLTPAGSVAVLGGAWNKLNRRVKRASENHDYLLVPEFHKSGKVHIHLLTTAVLKKKWWKDNARACGFGYQSDVQEVASLGGVSAYVAKYLTKMLQNSNLPKHFRRVRTSNGWPKLPELPPHPDWQFSLVKPDIPLAFIEKTYVAQGYRVVLADGISAWDWIEQGGVI